ncbi:DUF6121 family protein [Glaciihabitans sp. UYNi722]|uniref:DUF6121 family protein n=1 Tax=Glaciihabitans sp. UYNi722 TaxID=3156344 RepID=UPI003396F1BF
MAPQRRYASIIAVFATVLYLALIICSAGFIGLIGNREVLAERDAGPLVAPAMFLVASATLFAQLLNVGLRVGRRTGFLIVRSLVIAIVTSILYLLVGANLYALSSGRTVPGIIFFGNNAFTPVTLSVAVFAFLIAVAYQSLLNYRDRGGAGTTPRWSWEKKDGDDGEDRSQGA